MISLDHIVISLYMIVTSITILYLYKLVVGEVRSLTAGLSKRVNDIMESYIVISKSHSKIEKRLQDLEARIGELNLKIFSMGSLNAGNVKTNERRKEQGVSDIKRPKREKNIQPQLSNTEILILKLLLERPMSSREIKNKLGLSREHVARELKKLYEMGYIDRRTASKPYLYNIKKEYMDKVKEIVESH